MNGRERTLDFIRRRPVDRVPFHPIVMRWAARYAGVTYRDFCLDYRVKCGAMLKAARDFDMDWVTVMSDPYAEAQAFGLEVEFPEDGLPLERGRAFADAAAVARIVPYRAQEHARLRNRMDELREFRRLAGMEFFTVGWVEGPVAEYADLRGASNAAMDFYDDPDSVHTAMEVITESALDFIEAQVEAGADCIGIGDAFCSQIGPELYREFAFERERRMVERVHACGALAKLHICGNTAALLPEMIRTGADIIDVDHQVPSMEPFVSLLGPAQVFSGKPDPVSVIQQGDAVRIRESMAESLRQAKGRCIRSAGCEITPDTSLENMRIFSRASAAGAETE